MEKNTIAEISKRLNISSSTTGRVLRHCSGVDSEIRQRILREVGRPAAEISDRRAVYAILPDVPRYFWQPLKKGVLDTLRGTGVTYKINICAQAGDESTVLWYLDEAEALNSQIILLAAHVTPAIHRRLETMTDRRLILLLNNEYKLVNSFYVGSNTYGDGCAMGRCYAQHYRHRPLLMLTLPGNANAERRVDGFMDALREADPCLADGVRRVKLDQQIFKNLKLLPSKLALIMMEAAGAYEKLCIYSPTGIPQFPLALVKAKLTERAVCLCQDCYIKPGSTDAGRIVTCDQDGYAQGQTAAELILDFLAHGVYPKQKRTYVPSRIDFPPQPLAGE